MNNVTESHGIDPRFSPRVMVDSGGIRKCNKVEKIKLGHKNSAFESYHSTFLPVADSFHDNTSTEKENTKTTNSLHKQKQIAAYTHWVNAQLRQGSSTRYIDDLKNDVRDGVIFVELIEIIAGVRLNGVHRAPSTYRQMKENIDTVLHFMSSRKIKMHHTSARDIVDGDLRSIMRLVLALAAHFKPNNVKHSVQSAASSPAHSRNINIAGIAQGAAVTIAHARREAARVGRKSTRDRHMERSYNGSTCSSDPPSDSDQNFKMMVSSSPISRSRSTDLTNTAKDNSIEIEDPNYVSVEREFLQNLIREYDIMSRDLRETKDTLIKLQDLLMHGDSLEEDYDNSFERTPSEELILLQSKLQQSNMVYEDLKVDLSRTKLECIQLQGEKTGMQQRLSEREQIILKYKTDYENLYCAMKNNPDYDRDSFVSELQKELVQKNALIEELQRKSESLNAKSDNKELHKQIRTGGSQEASPKMQDRRPNKLETGVTRSRIPVHYRERQNVHSVTSNATHRQMQDANMNSLPNTALKPKNLTYVSDGESIFDDDRKLQHCIKESEKRFAKELLSQQKSSGSASLMKGDITKVLYFTDKTVTPFMCSIQKRLGDITLKEFKELFDGRNQYRYHFKALDPEFGTVKEEITEDSTVIPGWEGRIVAWIEDRSDSTPVT